MNQFKIVNKNDLIQFEQLHKSHLLKIKNSQFDIDEFIVYQDVLTDYILPFYNDELFQSYRLNPKLFIQTKTKQEIVNTLFAKCCFNLIDLLAVYINAIDTTIINCPTALANTILMELVWSQQTLSKELEIYL